MNCKWQKLQKPDSFRTVLKILPKCNPFKVLSTYCVLCLAEDEVEVGCRHHRLGTCTQSWRGSGMEIVVEIFLVLDVVVEE